MQEFSKAILDSDPQVRRIALNDLLSSREAQREATLVQALSKETDVQLKYEMRKGLAEIRSLGQVTEPSEAVDDGKLNKAFESDDPEQLRRAFYFALRHRKRSFLQKMETLCSESDDSFLKNCLIKMYLLEGNQSFSKIQVYLHEPDPRVVCTALETLSSLGSSSALASIASMTSHEDNRVRSTAIKALHELGDESVFQLFSKMVESEHSAYRDSAAYSIAALKLDSGVGLLEKLVRDEVESIRSKALQGLESLANEGNERAKEIVSASLQLKPKIYENLPGKAAAPVSNLPEALYSDDSSLRLQALKKLGDKGDTESVRAILQRLKLEKDPKVVSASLAALSRTRAPVEVKVRFLMAHLAHQSDRVRANALEALSGLLPEDRKDFFLAYLKDPNNRVVGNAILALGQSKNYTEAFSPYVMEALEDLLSSDENGKLTALYCIACLEPEEALAMIKAQLKSTPRLSDRALEILEQWSLNSAGAKAVLEEFHKESQSLETQSLPLEEPESKARIPDRDQPKKSTRISAAPPKKTRSVLIPWWRSQALIQVVLILGGFCPALRWIYILISNEANLIVRILSCTGLVLCSLWILMAILLDTLLRQKSMRVLESILFFDTLFTLICGCLLLIEGTPLAGIRYMILGLCTIAYVLYSLKKLNS
jgi:HEAT repeat protein